MAPKLSEEECLSLHLALLRDTILKTSSIRAERFLYLAGSGILPFDPGIPLQRQDGIDLGARLHNAFEETLQNFDRVIAIGTDSPTFHPELLSAAFEELEKYDVVLGPAEDGGYYLIGLKFLIPEIFLNIEWGSTGVLKKTLSALGQFQVRLLPPCFDVDTPEELDRLRNEIRLIDFAPNTKVWLHDHD